jgi:hypothetical protein
MASLASDRVRARRTSRLRPGNHRATVLVSPSTVDDPLTVWLHSESREIRHEIRDWFTRTTTLPLEDDVALVVVDDEGHIWAFVGGGS